MYQHTQFGTLVFFAVGSVILLIVSIGMAAGLHLLLLIVGALMTVVLFLFHSLTVEVTESLVTVRFGPGLIRRSFPVSAIRESRAVKNRWYYGWGIRLTPHGWLFNVSGFDAVEIKLDSGRQYRIGTDQPQELLAAIRTACGSHR